MKRKRLTSSERKKIEARVFTAINHIPDCEALGLLAETTARLLLRIGIPSAGPAFLEFKNTWELVLAHRLEEMEASSSSHL
jgi:hypothetical protein